MTQVYLVGRDEIPQNITLGKGESLDLVIAAFPGNVGDCPLTVNLDGEGAEVSISGFFICDGDDRLSLDINVRHNAGSCNSHQLINGIAAGNAHTRFHGLVYVAPDAQQTKAFQENHNILLADTAMVESMPQLEIYADDVQCSHGATTGFLNQDEQFYMQSRGIPEAQAKVLQMISFLSPVLASVRDDKERETLTEKVVQSVSQLASDL